MSAPSIYRGRLAPSPTGFLHLGHARTFAIAAERAASSGGELLLRVDDLDPQRSRPEYTQAAIDDLQWLGLDWQGEPLLQSTRRAAYRQAWQALALGGWLYPCQCSRRELTAIAAAPHESTSSPAFTHDEPLYPGTCRPSWQPGDHAGALEREAWAQAGPLGRNWRFRVPEGETMTIADRNLGPQAFTAGKHLGDFAVWRRDDVPAYQLATVVDDAFSGITEVVRGADLLLSAARQSLLFQALGLSEPGWFHCSLAVDATGTRLAKRNDALSIRSLRAAGHSPGQVLDMAKTLPIA